MARVPGTVSQDIPSGEGEFIASILIPTPIFSQVATTVTTRVIRTNRRIENEKLNNSHWFNGIRAPSPSNWAFERCGGARKAAYSVERECGVPCQRSKAQSGATCYNAQFHVAGSTPAEETRSLLQSDTSSECPKGARDPPTGPVQDSDPSGTSHPLALGSTLFFDIAL